jgi:plastocyanin
MLAIAGLGMVTSVQSQSRSGPEAAVSLQLFQFKPSPVEVKAGTAVTWTNGDDIEHTVTSGRPSGKDGRFAGKLTGKGASFSTTIREPGRYPYFCERHESMVGELRVEP